MKTLWLATMVTLIAAGLPGASRADEVSDAKAIVDKAISALGGADKLSNAKGYAWKAKGKISFGGNQGEFSSSTTVGGMDRSRSEFDGDFGGQPVKGVTVVNGDKGWRSFGGATAELDSPGLTNERRNLYLQVVSITLLPLKSSGFTIKSAGEGKVGDKPVMVVKATGPDTKEFKLYFDKATGLLAKLEAMVGNAEGQEFLQETTYEDYKEMGGIMKATKVSNKRDGERFIEQQVTEFNLLAEPDAKAFAAP
ncbi:MAG: hypothetical protein ACT4QC_09680 [Planctomycetaceae bacterium]